MQLEYTVNITIQTNGPRAVAKALIGGGGVYSYIRVMTN